MAEPPQPQTTSTIPGLSSSGTPAKKKYSGTPRAPYLTPTGTSEQHHRKAKRQMALEVFDEVVGGMPVEDFFKDFLPCDEDALKGFIKGVSNQLFDKIPSTSSNRKSKQKPKAGSKTDDTESQDEEEAEGNTKNNEQGGSTRIREPDMYPVLVDLINNNGLCPGFTFLNNSGGGDPNSLPDRRWAPDVGAYEAGNLPEDLKRPDFSKLVLPLEIKPSASYLPFHDLPDTPPKPSVEERRNHQYLPNLEDDQGIQYLGQLVTVMTEICARQPRTHVFMVFLRDPDVRFLRADRSGVVVSKGFNYRTQSKRLAEFFWRFSQASDAQRGFDNTVQPANEQETVIAKTNLKNYSKFERPVVKIAVPEGQGVRHVLAWDELSGPESLTGRGTRAIPVWDMKDNKVRFLKDSWRPEKLEKETDILTYLNNHGVANIPKVFAGGDLYSAADATSKFHRTIAHLYVDAEWRTGPVGSSAFPLEPRIHHRILEDFVAQSIVDCQNAEELMVVIRDAVIAHRDAYSHNILHRDISHNNVMLVRNEHGSVRGILGDWDMSMRFERNEKGEIIPPDGPRQRYRTGTWYFMSALLLQDASKLHALQDDLESFFHLVLYLSLYWFPFSGSQEPLGNIIRAVFEECSYNTDSGLYIGGRSKRSMFRDRTSIGNIDFTSNRPLTIWMKNMLQAFEDFYDEHRKRVRNPDHPHQPHHFDDHDFTLRELNDALDQTGWSDVKKTETHEEPVQIKRRRVFIDEDELKAKKQRKTDDDPYRPSGGSSKSQASEPRRSARRKTSTPQ